VLVRYNPEADPALNQRQTARLTELSEYCRAAGRRFIFELLVPATQAQMDRVQADQATYDLRVRPALMLRTIRQVLAANGVDVMLAEHDEYTPSPVVSHAIFTHNRGRARRPGRPHLSSRRPTTRRTTGASGWTRRRPLRAARARPLREDSAMRKQFGGHDEKTTGGS
jgi:hypothetical protein